MLNVLTACDMSVRRYRSLPDFHYATEPTTTRTVMSNCHRFDFAWKPEIGSPRCKRGDVVEPKGTKYHWAGSRCVHVVGQFAFQNKERTLHENDFSQVDRVWQCGLCAIQFEAR